MSEASLSDEQWLVLDLLIRARKKGRLWLRRSDLLTDNNLPQVAAMRLTFAALAMPGDLVKWDGDDLSITEAGMTKFYSRFARPSKMADSVIYLPGPAAEKT